MLFVDGDPGPEIRRKLNEMVAIWEQAILEAAGPAGWSPVFAIVSDGSRRVLQLVDWVGGEDTKPTTTGYIGASGIVADIALAIDIRGPVGATGPSNSLSIGTVTEGPASATITGTSPSQVLNLVIPKGDTGPSGTNGTDGINGTNGIDGTDGVDGLDGWSPILAVVSDSARRVLQIVDWTGGEGTKPPTGYAGPSGIVALIGDAVDIRGPAGSAGSVAWGDITDKPAVIAAGATATEAKTAISLQNVDNTSDLDKPISTATQTALDGKVAKVVGKGLSTEDYTTTEKTKLAGIASGATANTGTVTSVALSAPTGLTVGGSPVTSSGTLTITFAAGYSIPTDTSQSNWNTAYGWGNHATAGYLTTNPTLGTPVSGNLTNCTVDGTNQVGFKNIPRNSQSAAYTLVLADAGKHILHPAADTTARTYTIPSNASVPYPIGTAITFINQNGTGGIVTIAITTDTMRLAGAGTTGSRTLARNGIATALKITATEWIISGTGLT